MKAAQAKAIIQDVKSRGWIEANGVFYPPAQAAALGLETETSINSLKKQSRLNRLKSASNSKCEKKPKFDLFIRLCEIELVIAPVPEYCFDTSRKWRMDYAFVDQKIFVEVEGGVFTGGRHTRGQGFVNDMEKYNAAASLGWRLIRVVPSDIKDRPGYVIDLIKKLL